MADLSMLPIPYDDFWGEIEPLFRRFLKAQDVGLGTINWICSDLEARADDPELVEVVPTTRPEGGEADVGAALDCLTYLHGAFVNLLLNMNDLELMLHREERQLVRKG